MAQARKARGINRTEKRKQGSVTYSANREDEASEIFISAECTIGMVWGLTALKHYGNKALRV